ncbi:MAG: hypothetical protein KVP17_003828 [Porospora cf. gigantea B]|uniref:uncharacterized protein n=2 Tax=Porospora cf. gigantea B TaxID=2853592 RepID=UPI003571C941|nr:MAG: hypothetical protein KVP17_003828 [Porospora cf. gigantea B]
MWLSLEELDFSTDEGGCNVTFPLRWAPSGLVSCTHCGPLLILSSSDTIWSYAYMGLLLETIEGGAEQLFAEAFEDRYRLAAKKGREVRFFEATLEESWTQTHVQEVDSVATIVFWPDCPQVVPKIPGQGLGFDMTDNETIASVEVPIVRDGQLALLNLAAGTEAAIGSVSGAVVARYGPFYVSADADVKILCSSLSVLAQFEAPPDAPNWNWELTDASSDSCVLWGVHSRAVLRLSFQGLDPSIDEVAHSVEVYGGFRDSLIFRCRSVTAPGYSLMLTDSSVTAWSLRGRTNVIIAGGSLHMLSHESRVAATTDSHWTALIQQPFMSLSTCQRLEERVSDFDLVTERPPTHPEELEVCRPVFLVTLDSICAAGLEVQEATFH